jgi:hypothetical protein
MRAKFKNEDELRAILNKVKSRRGKLVLLSEVPNGGLIRSVEADAKGNRYEALAVTREDDKVKVTNAWDRLWSVIYTVYQADPTKQVRWLNSKEGELWLPEVAPAVNTIVTFNADGSVSGENIIHGYSGQKFAWANVTEYEAWKAEHTEGRVISEGKRPA